MMQEKLKIHNTVKHYFSEQVKRAFPDAQISDAEMDVLAQRYSLDETLLIVRAAMAKREEEKNRNQNTATQGDLQT